MGKESFLRNDNSQIKLLSEFFLIYIQPFTNDSNSRNNQSVGVQKLTGMGMRGCVWVGRKFLNN